MRCFELYALSSRPVPSAQGPEGSSDTLVVGVIETKRFYDRLGLMYALRQAIRAEMLGRFTIRTTHFTMSRYYRK